MLRLFKKKSSIESHQKKYEKLIKEWHKLSSTNRAESDKKYAEAELIASEIDRLKHIQQ
jgi:hypothetical protein